MEDLLISTLETLGYPVLLQGSLLPEQPYPDSFFTFWNDSSEGVALYDNTYEGATTWNYSINFYSTNPDLVSTELLRAKELLLRLGWVITGAGYSVPSDEITHTGRGIECSYRQ